VVSYAFGGLDFSFNPTCAFGRLCVSGREKKGGKNFEVNGAVVIDGVEE
jgi:hypothetical protein